MRDPVYYSAELAERILELLCEGRTLREICKGEGFPTEAAVRQWALNDHEGFAERYRRAREIGYHSMADEIVEIVDDATNDWMERENQRTGKIDVVPDHDHINRSRLRFQARQWLLSKALPKLYGDKIAVTGPEGGALQIQRIERVIVDPPPYRS